MCTQKTNVKTVTLNTTNIFDFFCSLSDAFSGPTPLKVSDETSDSIRFLWAAAGGPVTGYVVQYTPLTALGQPITAELQQVRMKTNVCSDTL